MSGRHYMRAKNYMHSTFLVSSFCLLNLLLNNCDGNDAKHNAFCSIDFWWFWQTDKHGYRQTDATDNNTSPALVVRVLGFRVAMTIFAARCYASAAYVIMRCLSVRLCVCHVRTFCQNEQTYLQICFITGYTHHSSFSVPNGIAIFRRETLLTRASNGGGVGRNRDSEPISGFTACC